MPETTVNIPLLRKAVEWAEAEAAKPFELSEWEQGFWILPKSDDDPHLPNPIGAGSAEKQRAARGKASACGTCFCIAGYTLQAEGRTVDWNGYGVDAAAGDVLGISREQGSRLFAADNTIEDVRRIAEEIAGERL